MTTPRAEMRRAMFLSQDSVVLCMTLRALDELGILARSLEEEQALTALYPEMSEAGFGALRVAMHSLLGAGWLNGGAPLKPETAIFRWTRAGRLAMGHRKRYVAIGDMLAGFALDDSEAWGKPWSESNVESFLEQVEHAVGRRSAGAAEKPSDLVGEQLDLALVVPVMLWLHEASRLGDRGPELPDDAFGEGAAVLLNRLDWLDASRAWSARGREARAFALNFGGVLTYLPLFARLPEIYRGELSVSHDPGEQEWHVLRDLNLRISGAAHKRYFSESESIFLELFDREPIEHQPAFIADMGCGDGSWLLHLHTAIAERTARGRHLRDHPLLMVGIDPDRGARETTQRKLEAAGADTLALSGDITDPERLAGDLARHGLQMEDGLHIRAFIDHERTYRGAADSTWAPGWTSGVYIDSAGRPIAAADVERDLIAHLKRWKPYARKHGLVVLEAHGVAPTFMSRHLGDLHGIAFDAHQAYSKQYTVEHASFLRCCQEAGLQPESLSERRYPSGRPFVSISINRLLAPGDGSPLPGVGQPRPQADGWRPDPDTDLEDGRALHEILFTRGDIRYPAQWCAPPTGFVVGGALDAIERKLETTAAGQTIRVMDYGAGTGTATIELLEACRERGIEKSLGSVGATLEVHLVDIPSSWFALGYELLQECDWTRFHSLRSDDGGFRPLPELLGERRIDVAMANMVFHLIPPRALERTADGLADVLAPDGSLFWSAPDLGPAGTEAVLLHDPNRALRQRWLELLEDADPDRLSSPLAEAVRRGRELDRKARRRAQERADRRIRPRPLATEVIEALATRFDGDAHTTACEMLSEDVVRGLLVPSNQAEYLPEIEDRRLREEAIRKLMLEDVLPRLQAGPAGTSLGLNLHWTLGHLSPLAGADRAAG